MINFYENNPNLFIFIITVLSVVIGFILSKTIKSKAELVLSICLFYAIVRLLELILLEKFNFTFPLHIRVLFILPAILLTIILTIKFIKE